MRHSDHRITLRKVGGAEPPDPEGPPLPTMEAISRGSREAFALLFDRTAAVIAADLTTRIPDPRQRIAILAGTYVEVWWLAGCAGHAGADVTGWITGILDRRVTDACRAGGPRVQDWPGPGRVELELADLLGRPPGDLWPG